MTDNNFIPTGTFRFLWYFSRKYKFKILSLFLIMVISTMFTAYFAPYALKIIINLYETKQLTIPTAMVYISFYIISISIEPMFHTLRNKLYLMTEDLIKRDFLSKTFSFLLNNDINYFNQNYSGDLTSKLTGLASGFQQIFRSFLNIFNSLFFFTASLIIIFNFNRYMFLISIIWIFLFYFSLKKLIAIRTKRFKISSQAKDKSAGIINDCIVNISNIKSFSNEKKEIKNVKTQSLNIIRSSGETVGISSMVLLTTYIMMRLYFFIMLSFLFYLFKQDKISLGEFMFILQVFASLISYVRAGLNSAIDINPKIASFQNSLDKIVIEPKIKDKKSAIELKVKAGKIVLKNVKFSYHG